MKTIVIPLSEYLALRDCEKCIDFFYEPSECIKGRVIQSGFICPHCGSNDPDLKCNGKSYEELESKFKNK